MDNFQIISAGFSATTGLKINPPPSSTASEACSYCGKYDCRRPRTGGAVPTTSTTPTVSCHPPIPRPGVFHVTSVDLVCLTYGMMQPPRPDADPENGDEMTVMVHMLKSNKRAVVKVQSSSTVQELRKEAADKLSLTPDHLMLIFNNNQLEDHQDIRYLDLAYDSMIIGKESIRGVQMGMFELDPSSFDPQYDYDLTHETKPTLGQTFQRNTFTYERPYGWKRTAIKVLDKYEDNTWLGADGIRTESTPDEWPVSYHGTSKASLRGIVEDGYRIGPRALYGPAVYTSPALEKVASWYASTFTHEEKSYELALQNRVDPNPDHLTVIDTGNPDFPYWLSPLQDPGQGVYHVRPYGILTREVSRKDPLQGSSVKGLFDFFSW